MDYVTEIHMEFPDERARGDFEAAFKGWLTQWQMQQMILRRLIEFTTPDEEKTEPKEALAAPRKHKLGFEEPDGLLTIDDVTLSYGDFEIDLGSVYLNFIPFI